MTFEFCTTLEYSTLAKPSSGPLEVCQARLCRVLLCIQALNDIPPNVSHNHLKLRFETQLSDSLPRGSVETNSSQEQKGLYSWQQLKRAWGNLADFIHH